MVGLDASQAIPVSAKTGVGIDELLEAIITYIPAPRADPDGPLKALIIDSWWDTYRGVVSLVRVMSGTLTAKQEVRFLATNKVYDVLEVGVFAPEPMKLPKLEAGEVGFVICNVKEVSDSKVGDTIALATEPNPTPLPGFKEVQQMVFAGVFPTDSNQYADLRDALGKLTLNDASVTWEPDTRSITTETSCARFVPFPMSGVVSFSAENDSWSPSAVTPE